MLTDEAYAIRQRNRFFKQNPKSGRSIKWFVDNARISTPCDFNDYKLDSHYADRFIKRCPVCCACWQYKVAFTKSIPIYYEDFPSLGKEESVCPRCSTSARQN